MSRVEEKAKHTTTVQFGLRNLFLIIFVASIVSLIWRWDRRAQDIWQQDEARREAERQSAYAAKVAEWTAGRRRAKELGFEFVSGIIEVRNVTNDESKGIQQRSYDQTLLNDLPPDQTLLNDLSP